MGASSVAIIRTPARRYTSAYTKEQKTAPSHERLDEPGLHRSVPRRGKGRTGTGTSTGKSGKLGTSCSSRRGEGTATRLTAGIRIVSPAPPAYTAASNRPAGGTAYVQVDTRQRDVEKVASGCSRSDRSARGLHWALAHDERGRQWRRRSASPVCIEFCPAFEQRSGADPAARFGSGGWTCSLRRLAPSRGPRGVL
jgi:hypothetical protein